jgi:hypothetical protein
MIPAENSSLGKGDTSMKKLRFIGILGLLLFAGTVQVFAGNETKTGTAGALEVLLPVGARGTAMGGATNSMLDGVEALNWNPAGLAGGWGESSVEAMFSHMDYIATTSVDYAAVGVSDLGVLGLTLRSFGFGDIAETTELFPDGTGRTFSPSYVTIGLTYAKALTDRIHIGFTGKYISETILRTSASGFALDAGMIYSVGNNGTLKGLRFGVALKNIGPNMQYRGDDLAQTVIPPNSAVGAAAVPLSFASQAFELPSSFELGVGYDYNLAPDLRLGVNAQFNNMNFGNDQYRAGGEFAFKEMFFLRGGYVGSGSTTQYVLGGTFGAGVNIEVGTFAIAVDYAYMTARVFDGVNVVSIRLKM